MSVRIFINDQCKMEAKNFLMKYVTITVKDMNLLIQDLDLIQTFMAHIYYLRAKRCDACSKNLFEDDTIHDCNEDLSIVLDECFESVKANVEKDILFAWFSWFRKFR